MYPESDYGPMIGGARMPRRLRRLRFTSQEIPPIIRLLLTRTNVMGWCLSKCHWGLISQTAFSSLGVLHRCPLWLVRSGKFADAADLASVLGELSVTPVYLVRTTVYNAPSQGLSGTCLSSTSLCVLYVGVRFGKYLVAA